MKKVLIAALALGASMLAACDSNSLHSAAAAATPAAQRITGAWVATDVLGPHRLVVQATGGDFLLTTEHGINYAGTLKGNTLELGSGIIGNAHYIPATDQLIFGGLSWSRAPR